MYALVVNREEPVKRHYMLFTLSLTLLFSLTSCKATIPDYDYSKEPDPSKSDLVVGVGDSLKITVWKNPDLSPNVTILPDGTITMPLIGKLKADGKTTDEIKQDIEKKLAKYLKVEDTEITIDVTNFTSYRFTVSGEVNQAGILTSNRFVTVAEAIAMAGGVTQFAKKNKMVLMRRDPKTGKIRRIPIAYELIASGKRQDMNLVLMSGDSLYVP